MSRSRSWAACSLLPEGCALRKGVGSMPEFSAESLIVIVNAVCVAIALVATGAWLAHGELSVTDPGRRQNVGEWVLQFFVGKAREMAHGPHRERIMKLVSSLLATFFLFI